MSTRRRRPVSKVKTFAVGSALAALTAVLLIVFVLRLASDPSGDAKVQLGDDVFEVGRVRELAPLVDRGGPLLFADPLNRGRDLYIQHVGEDAAKGWVAFEAHAPGERRRACNLTWDQERGVFTDPCTKATYSHDGVGLTHYPAEVRRKTKGGLTLFVDLRTPVTTG